MKERGFTLIELLIVVAIIAILAAIAIPNFLAAQTRSKVSRTQADLRSIATGLESYMVDNNVYPPYGRVISTSYAIEFPAVQNEMYGPQEYVSRGLTTPIAYITSIPTDPFAGNLANPLPFIREYNYLNLKQHIANFNGVGPAWVSELIPRWGEWRMAACGPDMDRGADIKSNIVYDPSNGTVSNGDIVRCQIRSDNSPNPRE
jgi:prepilin-type N-terminal cleavage/methylation domain-containing protein